MGAVVLSGCTGILSDEGYLTLALLNFDSMEHEMNIEIFRTEANEYSEAIVLREWYDLSTPPEDGAAYHRIEEEVLPSDKYIVRVDSETAPTTRATYPFYPALKGDDERTDKLFIEISTESDGSEPYIEFRQIIEIDYSYLQYSAVFY